MRLNTLNSFSHSIFSVSSIIFITAFFEVNLSLSHAYFMEDVRFEVRTISSALFETDVIDSEDAWILAVKGTKVSEEKWQTEENQLRGVVNVAYIDLQAEEKFWLEKGILEKDQPNPVAIVFPYGGEIIKKEKYKHVNSVQEAKYTALSSLSEYYVTWLRGKLDVEKFVRAAYTSWPPRFPVVLTTERKVTPPLYRALSLKYSRYFNFGIVHSSLAQDAMGLPKGVKVPRMDILISTLTPNHTLEFAALTYEERYGPVQYRYLIRFLFSAHEKHWPDLPGSRKYTEELDYEDYYQEDLSKIFSNPVSEKSKSKRENSKFPRSNLQEINYKNHKRVCDDTTPGHCVVAFLDGSAKTFREQLSLFSQVHNDKQLQDKVLQFMWINATCYPEFGSTFGFYIESLPGLLIAKPHRRYFAKHIGMFDNDSILEFIEKCLSGRISFSPYSRFDDLHQRKCSSQSKENESQSNDSPGVLQDDLKDSINDKEEKRNKEKRNKEGKESRKNDDDL